MDIRQIFELKTVAVIGCSTNPEKPAYGVPEYLQEHGYKIVPVNPKAQTILGEKAYTKLTDIPESIDIVVVFRPSEEIPQVAEQVFSRNDVKVLWLQEGITCQPVANEARKRGLVYIEDRCMYKEHQELKG